MNQRLTIGWLYPELMSTYGDRGNILILKKRCVLRGIECAIVPIDFETTPKQLEKMDIIFGGGAQDRQQGILIDDLRKNKREMLKKKIEEGTPSLFVCGSPQLLGRYYETADHKQLEGLHILDMETKQPPDGSARCIGNTVVRIGNQYKIDGIHYRDTIVGFENHGGRTYLDFSLEPFGSVLIGYGNNGQDKTEGARKHNCIATYSHGPLLAKNPHIADWLLYVALQRKGSKKWALKQLDDHYAWRAHDSMIVRLLNQQ